MVMRSELGVILSESGVAVILLRDEEVSTDENKGNPQHTTYMGQDGLHLLNPLAAEARLRVMALYSGILLLDAQPSSNLFCSLSKLRSSSVIPTNGFEVTPTSRPV
jgi:hypothetical protein